MTLMGRRTRKSFKIGDPIRVRVARADIEKRTIDFSLVGMEGGATEEPAPRGEVIHPAKNHRRSRIDRKGKPREPRRR